jgi:hypothetical protein
VAVLLARQQENQFLAQQLRERPAATAAGSKAAVVAAQQQQTSALAAASLSASAQILLRNPCHTVLERSVPQKRWPVAAHHVSWFSVMSKLFHRSFVDAAAKSLAPDDAAVTARAHATLTQLWRGPVLRMMLTGLSNLEATARQDAITTGTARRCAAIVVDALVNATRPSQLAGAAAAHSRERIMGLFRQQVLSHYCGTAVYMAPPVTAAHAVAVAAAVALDKATAGSGADTATSCVDAFVQECCSKLGQMVGSRVAGGGAGVVGSGAAGGDLFSIGASAAAAASSSSLSTAGSSSSASKAGRQTLPRDSDQVADATGIEQLLCFSHMASALGALTQMSAASAEAKRVVAAAFAQQQQQTNSTSARSVLVKLASVCAGRAAKSESASWLLSEIITPLAALFNIPLNVAADGAKAAAAVAVPEVTKSVRAAYLGFSRELLTF